MNFKHPTIQPTNQGQNTYEEHAWNCKETQLTTMKHRQTTNQTTNQDKQINFKTRNGKQGNTWNTMEQQCHTSSKQPTNQPTKQAMKGNENDEENGNSHKNKTTTKKHKQTTNQPTNQPHFIQQQKVFDNTICVDPNAPRSSHISARLPANSACPFGLANP